MQIYEYGLRNFIPLCGPATREPMDGTESPVRLSLGFTPKWYRQRLGIDFSQSWHEDPIVRYDSLLHTKRYLHETFPRHEPFAPRYNAAGVETACATVSGVYGVMLVPQAYGITPVYAQDDWPASRPEDVAPLAALERLSPFDIEDIPIVRRVLDQMDILAARYGTIDGFLHYQGVLNNALRIRGNEIFLDMLDRPEFVHHFFSHIADTMIGMAKLFQARQRRAGFDIDMISNSNCVMNMISPTMYEEFVRPYDIKIANAFARFGIHTCNWVIDPYIDSLRGFPKPLGYIDMGFNSDLAKAKAAFPDSRRAVMYSPVALMQKNIDEIRADLQRIERLLAPCDIVVADVDSETDDRRIHDVISMLADMDSAP